MNFSYDALFADHKYISSVLVVTLYLFIAVYILNKVLYNIIVLKYRSLFIFYVDIC